jgi:alkylhydroperoxidase family enzyme
VGRATGAVTEEQLRELDRYEQSDAFSPLEKLVLDFATRLSQTPVEVSDGLRAELRRHLTETQLVEIAAVAVWENHRARLNRAFGIEAAGFSEGAFCPLPHRPADG